MKHRMITLFVAVVAIVAAATGGSAPTANAAPDGTRPPITTPPATGDTEPPVEAIVASHDPTKSCGDWYLEAMYGAKWPTESTWWEYMCQSASMDYAFDFYFWNGTASVFYGTWQAYAYWDDGYYWSCSWWDQATGEWHGEFSCTEPNPGLPPNVAPQAAFTADCVGLTCTFDARGSSDSDGRIWRWDWNFGDNSQAGGRDVIEHTYRQSGSYTVALTVSDDRDGTDSVAEQVAVDGVPPPPNSAPTARFSVTCSGLTCSFDGRASIDSDGTIGAYSWNFGDGTGVGGNTDRATIDHTYPRPGTYTAGLAVTDTGGASASVWQTVTVNPPNTAPTASFTVTCNALACSFDGRGSVDDDGTVTSYTWNFGDGSLLAAGSVANHTYASSGSHTVTLTVIDNGGLAATDTRVVTTLTVPGAPRSVTATPVGSTAGVRFTAPLSDGGAAITRYTARCTSTNGGVTRQTQGPASPITVPSLSGGKTYTCTVQATNAIGNGPTSPPTTPFRVPR